jgi:hypothetical protein
VGDVEIDDNRGAVSGDLESRRRSQLESEYNSPRRALELSNRDGVVLLALTASSFFPRVLSKPVLKKKVSGCRKFERSGIIPSQDGEDVRETLAAISRELKTFAS